MITEDMLVELENLKEKRVRIYVPGGTVVGKLKEIKQRFLEGTNISEGHVRLTDKDGRFQFANLQEITAFGEISWGVSLVPTDF